MPAPKNTFKQALKEGRTQIGLWQALTNPTTVEISANAGYDWLLLDGEHAPNDVPLLLSQLRAMQGSPAHPIIRLPIGETWMVKQALDIGAQTLLIPMVESGDMARDMAKAMLYPPHGVRGVGAALARASAYNTIPGYLQTANDEVCLLLQIESRKGLEALDAITGTEGVDGVFIGPADLAADMGHMGNPGHPDVQAAVKDAIQRIQAHGKAAGILIGDLGLARSYVELGATFVGIGNDVTLFMEATRKLLKDFAQTPASTDSSSAKVY